MVLPWYFEMPWSPVKTPWYCIWYGNYSGKGYFSGLGKLSCVIIVYIVLITIFADQHLCYLLQFLLFHELFYVLCMFYMYVFMHPS